MTKRMGSGLIIGLGILVFSLSASAQRSSTGVVRLNGGRNAILRMGPSQAVTPAVLPNLVKIYSTLGTGDHVYSTLSGFGILGTETGRCCRRWWRMASGRRRITL